MIPQHLNTYILPTALKINMGKNYANLDGICICSTQPSVRHTACFPENTERVHRILRKFQSQTSVCSLGKEEQDPRRLCNIIGTDELANCMFLVIQIQGQWQGLLQLSQGTRLSESQEGPGLALYSSFPANNKRALTDPVLALSRTRDA